MPSVLNLSCKPIPLVRIALIGIGSRGMKTLERYAYIKGAEIRYIADLSPERLELANQKLEKSGRHRAHTLQGEDAWIQACKKDDIDLIYICTEWKSHATIAIEAMKRGKHVAVEVPRSHTATSVYDRKLLLRLLCARNSRNAQARTFRRNNTLRRRIHPQSITSSCS